MSKSNEIKKQMRKFISRAKKDAETMQKDEDTINYRFNRLTRNAWFRRRISVAFNLSYLMRRAMSHNLTEMRR